MTSLNCLLSDIDLLVSTSLSGDSDALARTGKILHLMTAFSQQPSGLSILLDRYSSQASVVVLRPLSFLLAQAANNPMDRTVYRLLFSFLHVSQSTDPTVCECIYCSTPLGHCEATSRRKYALSQLFICVCSRWFNG